jgi:tetraacyldisaccharide 4'-kinase
LLPFSALFGALSALRRAAYRFGWLESERLPVALIVVGNITVGGSGKTPLVLWLVRWLKQHGFHPGIVSRGYGGKAETPMRAEPGGDAALVGDEPLLLARRGDCPVWIGRDRVAAGRALLAAHPECDVIVGDDGLQHYRLRRDVEIVVVDGQRRFGNEYLLPAGPLREGVGRLREVDAVVVNGDETVVLPGAAFHMRLQGAVLRNLLSGASVDAKMFQGRKLHAVAGIGNPQRFFDHLRGLGLVFEAHAFPDHHAFVAGDLDWNDADAVLMTEKDAVKCAAFASDRHWMLAVEAEVDPGLGQLVLNKLKGVR